VRGDTLSVYPLNGDWTPVRREYWWHALVAVDLPPRPSVLLVGLGGGTQVHLLRELARPRRLTIIERDPVILKVAQEWFGLGGLGGIEFLCADAGVVVPALARSGRRFDFIMEDAAYAEDSERSLPLARGLADLVSTRGVLVVNRHRHGDARGLARALRPLFASVRLRRVRREGENVLVCCAGPVRRS
jgi:spermidine synthase